MICFIHSLSGSVSILPFVLIPLVEIFTLYFLLIYIILDYFPTIPPKIYRDYTRKKRPEKRIGSALWSILFEYPYSIPLKLQSHHMHTSSGVRPPATWPGDRPNGEVQSARRMIIDDLISGNRVFVQAKNNICVRCVFCVAVSMCIVRIIVLMILSYGLLSSSGRSVLSSIRFISF